MKDNKFFIFCVLIISFATILAISVASLTRDDSIATTTNPTPLPSNSTSSSQLELPDEEALIQTYTAEIEKITDIAIESTTYENYKNDDGTITIDIIVKMNDGKTLNIHAMYIEFIKSASWSVISIKNNENSHTYYISGDNNLVADMYDYTTDKLVSKEQFLNTCTLKKVKFSFPKSWNKENNKSGTGYLFSDPQRNDLQISVFTNKAPYKSLEKTWSALSSNFDNCRLKSKEKIKLGKKNAMQWEYTFDTEYSNSSYTSVMTLAIEKTTLYCFILTTSSAVPDYSAYGILISSVSWKK